MIIIKQFNCETVGDLLLAVAQCGVPPSTPIMSWDGDLITVKLLNHKDGFALEIVSKEEKRGAK